MARRLPPERNETVHSMLVAALSKACEYSKVHREIASRMTLIFGDAIKTLPSLSPDVVIVDPMHPPISKSSVKAQMRDLRNITDDDDKLEL